MPRLTSRRHGESASAYLRRISAAAVPPPLAAAAIRRGSRPERRPMLYRRLDVSSPMRIALRDGFAYRHESLGFPSEASASQRADEIAEEIITTALSHQTRSHTYNLGTDQFAWAVGMSAMLGCISSSDGLRDHQLSMSAQETEVIRHIFIEYVYNFGITFPIYPNSGHLDCLNAYVRCNERYIRLRSVPAIGTAVYVNGLDGNGDNPLRPILETGLRYGHGPLVSAYEAYILRDRASERQQARFVRIEGEPRTSDKSVLFSRWNR